MARSGDWSVGEPQGIAQEPAHIEIDAQLLFHGDYARQGDDLVISGGPLNVRVLQGYFAGEPQATLVSPEGATLSPWVVNALAPAPVHYAQAGGALASGAAAIGEIESLDGTATIQRTDGTLVTAGTGTPCYQGDVVITGGGSKLTIVLADGTAVSMSASARLVLNELVYEPGGDDNSLLMGLVQGTFVFVTGQVAKTGNMAVDTPVATMGIRGTTPVVSVSAESGATEFSIAPDPDGTVGSYVLISKVTGEVIGTVNSTALSYLLGSVTDTPQPATPSGDGDVAVLLQDTYRAHQNAPANNQNQQQDDGDTDTQPPANGQTDDGDDAPPEGEGDGTPGGGGPDGGPGTGLPGTQQGLPGTGVPPTGGPNGPGGIQPNGPGPAGDGNGGDGTQGSTQPENRAPFAIDLNFSPNAGIFSLTGKLVAIDPDDGDTLTYSLVSGSVGSLNPSTGVFTITAGPGFAALAAGETITRTFSFKVTDQDGLSSSAQPVKVTFTGVNDAPTTEDRAVTTQEGSYTFSLADFAFNDVDNGDEIEWIRVSNLSGDGTFYLGEEAITGPKEITAAQIESGLFTFEGNLEGEGGSGSAGFDFQVSDGDAYSGTAEMSLAFDSEHAPTAHDDTIERGGALSNASFANGAAEWTLVQQTYEGSGEVVGQGASAVYEMAFSATASSGETGYGPTLRSDPFYAQAGDVGFVEWALDTPDNSGTYDEAIGEAYLIMGGTEILIGTITQGLGDPAVHGVIEYAFESGGTYQLELRLSSFDSTLGQVIGGIMQVDTADLLSTIHEDQLFPIYAEQLLYNDTDPDADALEIVSVDGTSEEGATVTLVDGNIHYDPTEALNHLGAGDSIVDSFTYTISDPDGLTSTATVEVTVQGRDDAPEITGDTSGQVEEGLVETASGLVTAEDPDDGESGFGDQELTIAGVYGTFTFNSSSESSEAQWDYILDTADLDQDLFGLGSGTDTEVFTVTTLDGTDVDIEIEVTGSEPEFMGFGMFSLSLPGPEGSGGGEVFELERQEGPAAIDGFDPLSDSIDIDELLETAFDPSNPNAFVKAELAAPTEGGFGQINVSIDADGPGSAAGFEQAAVLTLDRPVSDAVLTVVFGESSAGVDATAPSETG